MLVGTTIGEVGMSDFLLARLNPDGSMDRDFGNDGVVTGDLTGTDDYLTCVTLQPDGQILAVGWAGFYPDFLVQCYNPDGSVDQDFRLRRLGPYRLPRRSRTAPVRRSSSRTVDSCWQAMSLALISTSRAIRPGPLSIQGRAAADPGPIDSIGEDQVGAAKRLDTPQAETEP